MTMETKTNVFAEHLPQYLKSTKEEKGRILDHVCFVANFTRKGAIRKFRRLERMTVLREQKRQGRPRQYGPDVTAALKVVWESGSRVCGELLHPMINEYLDIFIRDRQWKYGKETTEQLRQISLATCKRRVGQFQNFKLKQHGISSTKPSHLKHLVPIFIGPWKDKPPGYGQIDTVRHSQSASGDAVYTLNVTDAASMTSFQRAQWNKGQEATRGSMIWMRTNLPFELLGAHPDTGSEFINHFVINWCRESGIELSRSRPNQQVWVEAETPTLRF